MCKEAQIKLAIVHSKILVGEIYNKTNKSGILLPWCTIILPKIRKIDDFVSNVQNDIN